MKVRQGFVSNSSSSSFIVAFPRGMRTKSEDVHRYLFGEEETVSCYDYSITTKQAADIVTGDMREQCPNNLGKLADFLSYDVDGKYPTLCDFWDGEKRMYDKNAYMDALEKHAAAIIEDAHKELGLAPGGYDFYVFEYSDNDGEWGVVMEHGDIFANVPYDRQSHH
jgi:hypothetical protein